MSSARFDAMRHSMVVSQLRPSGVTDVRLLAAMSSVWREAFVPEALQAAAYTDRAVPLADGRALNPPLVTALLLQEASIGQGDNVLLVGAATGYGAALVAGIGAVPIALECDAALADAVRRLVPAAQVVEGALAEGCPQLAPFDAIVIEGLVERLPDALVAQLKPDGVLSLALSDRGVSRIMRGRKGGSGFGVSLVADADAVPLPGFAREAVFAF